MHILAAKKSAEIEIATKIRKMPAKLEIKKSKANASYKPQVVAKEQIKDGKK